METSYSQIDVNACEQADQHPGCIFPRKLTDCWLVLGKPPQVNQPPQWHVVRKEPELFVPAFPHLVDPDIPKLLAYASQLSIHLGNSVQGDIKHLHVVIGQPPRLVLHRTAANPEGEERWQIFLGFAVQPAVPENYL